MKNQIQLNVDQNKALMAIEQFLLAPSADAFVLCGSAGTGKTTLVARIIEMASRLNLSSLLVAPTGRAARILKGKLDSLLPPDLDPMDVSTIHGAIYYMASMSVDEYQSALYMDFPIRQRGDSFDLIIVDEASMVGDKGMHQESIRFGSGRLLSDLVGYVHKVYQEGIVSRPIKLLFVGDLAQLSPVGSDVSPALSPDYLHDRFGLQVNRYELTTVMRQSDKSNILTLANSIREQVFQTSGQPLHINFNDTDLGLISFEVAVQAIVSNVIHQRSSVAVVYSNRTALSYNLAIRQQLWGNAQSELMSGDTLLVTRNCPAQGLSNGDLVKVNAVQTAPLQEVVCLPSGVKVPLQFIEVSLLVNNPSNDPQYISCLVLLNLLFSNERELSCEQQFAMYELLRRRHPHVDPNSTEFSELRQSDPYYNAVQVKFGYALTCHKAQGGEWDQVIVDPSGLKMNTEKDYRWLYTAVTRASESLLLVE